MIISTCVYSLLVLQESLSMLLPVSSPHTRDVGGHGISGVQGHGLSGVMTEHTEHGLEVRDIALQRKEDEQKEVEEVVEEEEEMEEGWRSKEWRMER